MGRLMMYSPEVRERAVRMVLEHRGEHRWEWAAICSIAEKFGCSSETLRKWVRRAETDQGLRPGLTSPERERLKALERENRELRRANEILGKASAYFAQAELDRRPSTMTTFVDAHREPTTGSSRSALSCRSPHPPIGSTNAASANPNVARPGPGVIAELRPQIRRVWEVPTSGCTEPAKCGASYTVKGSGWHAARWNDSCASKA